MAKLFHAGLHAALTVFLAEDLVANLASALVFHQVDQLHEVSGDTVLKHACLALFAH